MDMKVETLSMVEVDGEYKAIGYFIKQPTQVTGTKFQFLEWL